MRFLATAAIITTLLTSVSARAETYVFSDSQAASFSDLATAKLTITDITGGTQWTLSGIYDAAVYPSAFLHSISYDYSGPAQNKNSPLAMTNFSVIAGEVEVKDSEVSGVSFNTKAGATRFTSGDVVQWTFANTTSSQFSNLSAHLNAIDDGKSVKFNAVLSPVSPRSGTRYVADVRRRCRRVVGTVTPAPARRPVFGRFTAHYGVMGKPFQHIDLRIVEQLNYTATVVQLKSHVPR